MNGITDNERERWIQRWHDTVWERFADDGWSRLAATSFDPLVVVTAWNPGGHRLPNAVNQARDVVLRTELHALGCTLLRARGRSPDGLWYEDGWQIPHVPSRTHRLLRRYGQLAGWVTDANGAHYHWWE